jgi:hypothetical protein
MIKKMNNLDIGIIVEVDGQKGKVATFDNRNHTNFIHAGSLIKNVSVNSFVIINQGFIKIVARINSESIWDSQMKHQDSGLDRRFSKNSIKRTLEIQTIGYITKNKFISGASFLPMIGNECSIPTDEDINNIYLSNYTDENAMFTINIGKSLVEQSEILLPIDTFFASHIGIFGNTGSGKSNTLHRMFFELFSHRLLPNIKKNSHFLVIDFNGEYNHENSFGVKSSDKDKVVYNLNSDNTENSKYPIHTTAFFDEEMLSILFQATAQTQRPFISRVLKQQKKYGLGANSISNWISFIISKIFTNEPNQDIRDMFLSIMTDYYPGISPYLNVIKQTQIFNGRGDSKPCFFINSTYFNGQWTSTEQDLLLVPDITNYIVYTSLPSLKEFELRCKLQLINDLLYGNVMNEHISPLIKRIESRLYSIQNYIVVSDADIDIPFLQIVSFRNLNHQAKRILSLMISKMHFDKQKLNSTSESFHLIIDEAHNILSNQSANEHDGWKDYRLELFEEIIKEGRKFSFFLTLASQRPADISPTILSQVHNFFLHKLVNERDLMIINNSLSTLDKVSKSMLPNLAQGVCIVSGNAVSMPITVLVDFIDDKDTRPNSDTITLTDIWK